MCRNTLLFVTVLISLLCAGCGSEGQSGNASTVYIDYISTKAGTTGAVFANVSGANSANYSANQMSYTLASKVYPGSTKIPASTIEIANVSIAYSPVITALCAPPVFNPVNGIVNIPRSLLPGGTVDVENVPVLYPSDMVQIYASVPAGTRVCQYDVAMTFNGTEVNTGIRVSKAITSTAYVSIKK